MLLHICNQKQTETVLDMERGETIFFQGDPARHWYEVLCGTVRSCRLLLDGSRQLVGFHFPGDVFGVEEHHRSVSADCVTKARIRRFPIIPEQLTDRDAPYARAYHMAKRVIYLMGHRTAQERLGTFLLHAADRMGVNGEITLPMSRSDIADHLGLTIHTVSRTLQAMARAGVIEIRGRQNVSIKDKAGLTQLAGEFEGFAETSPLRHNLQENLP